MEPGVSSRAFGDVEPRRIAYTSFELEVFAMTAFVRLILFKSASSELHYALSRAKRFYRRKMENAKLVYLNYSSFIKFDR